MSRTVVPDFKDVPLADTETIATRDLCQELLESVYGDYDKAGDPEDAAYYAGRIDVLFEILNSITVHTKCPIEKEVRNNPDQHGNITVYGYCEHGALVSETKDKIL